jgi:hypothetical protein
LIEWTSYQPQERLCMEYGTNLVFSFWVYKKLAVGTFRTRADGTKKHFLSRSCLYTDCRGRHIPFFSLLAAPASNSSEFEFPILVFPFIRISLSFSTEGSMSLWASSPTSADFLMGLPAVLESHASCPQTPGFCSSPSPSRIVLSLLPHSAIRA